MKAAEKKSSFEIGHLINTAKALAEDASTSLPLVLSKELRHLPVPRSGFEAQVKYLFLASEEGGLDELGLEQEKMQALLQRVDQTQQLIHWLQRVLTQAEFSLRIDRADAWTIFVQQYAMLSGQAMVKPAIEQAIAPIVEFMAYDSKPKKAKNQDVEEPVTPAPVVLVKESNG